jgi:Flp pilus assembly pilin Flp
MMHVTSYTPRRVVSFVQSRVRSDDGAAFVEYALLIGLIALVVLVAVTFFGNALDDKYDYISSGIVDATD